MFLIYENRIEDLEIQSKNLNFNDFNTKFEIFGISFNKSICSKFRPLNYKVEILKNQRNSILQQREKAMSTGSYEKIDEEAFDENR